MAPRTALATVGAVAVGFLAAAAAAAPASRERFELSTEMEAKVAVHQDLVTNAGRSTDDFCKLAADTVEILNPIVIELSRFGGSEHGGVPFSAIERAYKRTQWLVPGLTLVATEEVMLTGIDYRWLEKTAPPEARPLMRALGSFELGKEGVVSWGRRITDESICAAPERGRSALAAVVKAWPTAPGCLKDALRARLSEELDQMVEWTCYCGAREPAQAAVNKSAGLLRGLQDLHGTKLANRWLQIAHAPDTRFGCSPE